VNNCFQKKPIYYGAWMHPATKLYHMIDFVVMRSSQRMHCLDVQVMREVNYWTDHCMVRAKLRLLFSHGGGIQKHPLPFAVHKFSSQEISYEYVRFLEQKVDCSPSTECTA